MSVRGDGRIGMPSFENGPWALHNNLEQFRQYVVHADGEHSIRPFYHVKIEFINANHLVYGQPASQLPETVITLLMHLLDEYLPNGILSLEEIFRAENILHEIKGKLLENQQVDTNLSEQFYQIIPQNGSPERLQIINNRTMYRNKIVVLDCLRSALKAIYAGVRNIEMNPIDYFTRYWLRTELNELDPTRIEFQTLHQCTARTQHPNERRYRLSKALKVTSSADIEFNNEALNQCLLYHFTFPCNILGILREGLQVAPQHIYSRNRFFGDGIYFWDCASMALSGFDDLPVEMLPILLVCRVALGSIAEVPHMYLEHGNVLQLPNGNDSFFCKGSHFPNVQSNSVDLDNAKMFCGSIASSGANASFDSYNKYMVQNRQQVKVEYILQFEKNQ